MFFCELLFEWLEDVVDFYFKEENLMLLNFYKVVFLEFIKLSLFFNVVDVIVKEGSDKGCGVLK